jgi:hypothetical protein
LHLDLGFMKPAAAVYSPQALEIIQMPDRCTRIIAGRYVPSRKTVFLVLGNAAVLAVPLRWFREAPLGAVPDPEHLSIVDCGLMVRMGEYETPTQAILDAFG